MNLSKKIMGSLALRILIVCTILLVIPLLLNTFVIYRQDYVLKMRELFNELKIIGFGRELLLEQIIASEQESLDLISLAIKDKSLEEQNQILEKIKTEQHLSSLTIQCFPSEITNSSLKLVQGNGEKQLFIEKTVNGCAIQLGLSAQQLINNLSYLEGTPYPFHLSLMDTNNELFVSDTDELTPSSVRIFTLDSIKKRSFFSRLIHLEKKGGHIGLQIPIKDTTLSLVITVPQEAVADVEKSKILSRVSSLFFLTLILGTAGAIWLTRRMARPLTALCQIMEKVGKGDLTARFKPDPMGFEINVLGNDFNAMIKSLLKHMEEAKNERIARVLLENELKIGQEIQMSMLPREMPQVTGLDIAAGLQPAKEVAGDFYDLYLKGEQNSLMFAIADASGKGISACLYSLSVRGMLRSFTASHENFSEIVRLTNKLFCQDTGDTGAFVTAWIGNLDLVTRELEYCSCGHPPALLKRKNGHIEELATPNMAFGVMPFEKVFTFKTQLFSGDLLLMYTDGLIEAHNQEMQLLGKKRLMELVNATQDETAQELIHYFMSKVALFEKGSSQYDDLTLLVVRIL